MWRGIRIDRARERKKKERREGWGQRENERGEERWGRKEKRDRRKRRG